MPDPVLPFPERSTTDSHDAATLAAFRDGQPEAIARVRRWIRGAASPFRRAIAAEMEDLEQETLLSLTQTVRQGEFEGRSSFATYVRRAVLYRCINRLRDSRRREIQPFEENEHLSKHISPERTSEIREQTQAALQVMARLGTACRQLWAMLHAGASYREMSEQLGVAPGTLRVRVLRCRRKAVEEWRRLTGEER